MCTGACNKTCEIRGQIAFPLPQILPGFELEVLITGNNIVGVVQARLSGGRTELACGAPEDAGDHGISGARANWALDGRAAMRPRVEQGAVRPGQPSANAGNYYSGRGSH